MNVCIVHNEYGARSGEEVMVDTITALLRARGHRVARFTRSSADIPDTLGGKGKAFLTGIHSPRAIRALDDLVRRERPDVVVFQNVFPLISSGAFAVPGRYGAATIFRCDNYRMFCPNGMLLSHGELCERCVGGKEYWCTLRNCEGDFAKSVGYTIRNWWTRTSGNITRNTDMYSVQTAFQKSKYAGWGIPEDRIRIIPNFVDTNCERHEAVGEEPYVGYAGRISPEKGIDTLLDAARWLEEVPFRLAGSQGRMPGITDRAPSNVEFRGFIRPPELERFYASARVMVLPSVCYEALPVVLLEAMLQGVPFVCSRIGGLPEIVEEQRHGLLFEPGDADDLARKIRYLWERPDLCRDMGEAARRKILEAHSPGRYYEDLLGMFLEARRRVDDRTARRSA